SITTADTDVRIATSPGTRGKRAGQSPARGWQRVAFYAGRPDPANQRSRIGERHDTMKIAVWHNLPSGGGKRALFYHVRGLVERGHEVVSWSLDTADRDYIPLSDLVVEHVLPAENANHSRRRLKESVGRDYHQAIARLRSFDEA